MTTDPLTLTSNEIERLLPLAAKDVLDEVISSAAHMYPPNPVKRDEYLAHERRRCERKIERFHALALAWLDTKMEIISS